MNYCLWFEKEKEIWQIVDKNNNVFFEGDIELCVNKINELNPIEEEPNIIIE